MSDFRNQIKEDILEYQGRFPHISNIRKDEWAFNFWVLDKLFSEEEDLIEEKIVDYNDKGIDCFIWHEDSLDLYLIQNKYYADGTNLTVDYVFNDFLTRSLGALEKGTYTRSAELQDIFNKYHEEEGFCIHFQLYVTNNTCINTTLVNKLKEYNQNNALKHLDVKMFSLSDIEELYYRKPTIDKKKFSFEIQTINKGTLLKIDNAAYKMTLAADARYVLTPVVCVYNMLKASKEAGYPLFNENIREYLGANGSINKGIVDTLKDPSERNNFFFYNNGITMIVDEMDTDTTSGSNVTGLRVAR